MEKGPGATAHAGRRAQHAYICVGVGMENMNVPTFTEYEIIKIGQEFPKGVCLTCVRRRALTTESLWKSQLEAI